MKFYYCTERELIPDRFSQLIMDVIGAPYSHAFILVEDMPVGFRVRLGLPIDGEIIFHATMPKYDKISLKAELAMGGEIMEKIPIEVFDDRFALGWLEGNMDKEYSLSQCIGVAYPELRPIFENGAGKGFCSEFCARFGALHSVRPDFFSNVDVEFMNPKEGVVLFKNLQALVNAG